MKKHMKRLASPTVWSIPKKDHIWAVRQSPGPHPQNRSVPLLTVIRDMLDYCDTARESKMIIGGGDIMIDGRIASDYKFPVGFMDVITISKTNDCFRTLLDIKGKLRPIKISKDRARWKLARIENITVVKNGKTQLNLHDGRNILVEKGKYKTGDVLKIELPSQKIIDSYPLAKGNMAMIIGGKHAGQVATIRDYRIVRSPKPNIVSFNEGFSTIKDHVFVVGTKAPEITIPEVTVI
jgi:small subunit ribosomal protein S4e